MGHVNYKSTYQSIRSSEVLQANITHLIFTKKKSLTLRVSNKDEDQPGGYSRYRSVGGIFRYFSKFFNNG
jgi:hypothetical protein